MLRPKGEEEIMLFWIIILIVVISVIKKKNKNAENTGRFNYSNMNNTTQNRPVQNAQAQSRPVQNPPMQGRPVQNARQNGSAQNASAKTASGGQKKPSVTEYLGQKAAEDQREHAVEAFEQQKRMQKKYGSMPVAGRYILGDPVPKSCQLVYCSYCGAENIVKMGYRGGMSCYFCRTGL